MKKCVVCRMPIDALPQTVTVKRGDDQWEFCSDQCASAFLAEPLKYENVGDEDDDD